MAYTSNVPQGNQQIATTQPTIQANFGFLNTGIGEEHNFNSAGSGTDMYHLKASMPNLALSPVLPAGTNGVYFVNSGNGCYFDGTTNWRTNQFQEVLTGTFTATNAFTTVVAVPANVVGFGIFYKQSGTRYMSSFTFFSDAGNTYAFSNRIKINGSSDDYPVEMNNSVASLNLEGQRFSSTYGGNYTFKIWYRPA